jgi:hypothetical protein
MQRDQTTRWVLFVDESGQFERPDDPVAVAGVLWTEGVRGSGAADMKRALLRAVPGLPWPLHASLLNQSAYVALASERTMRERPSSLDEVGITVAVRQAVSVLLEYDRHLVNAELTALSWRPTVDVLRPLSAILREHTPLVHERLRHHANQGWAAVGRLLAALAAQNTDRAYPDVALVTASETELGDAIEEGSTGDRYLAVLEPLLERTARLLERRDGAHELVLRASRRDVFDSRLATRGALAPPHLAALAREASTSRVRVVVGGVERFDVHVDPGYVLADFAANHARRTLLVPTRPVRLAEQKLADRLVVSVRSGTTALSHLAASGASRALINAAADLQDRPERVLPATLPRRRWACEQAWEWAEATR